MRRNFVLFIVLFLLNGCSLNQLFLLDEIDKVNVVKYKPYSKHYRAYYTRKNLKTVVKKHKYLFLYNTKKQDLAIVLHKENRYLLYSFANPDLPVIKFKPTHKNSLKSALHHFGRLGYYQEDLTELGYTVQTGLRQYKGVKTLMVEVQNYSELQKIYKEAIKNYQAKKVLTIKTVLPHELISSYFTHYYDKADSEEQRMQLSRIAHKLQITLEGEALQKTQVQSLYPYYLKYASIDELKSYLNNPHHKQTLSSSQYSRLQYRLVEIQNEKLLQEGSLETLIASYKKNKDPRFKKRILELMKQIQEETEN